MNAITRTPAQYEDAAAVANMEGWYTATKEAAFIDFLLKCVPGGLTGDLLEIGGGVGTHGLLISKRIAGHYRHSDYAQTMVQEAGRKGLQSDVVDGLNMPYPAASWDNIIGVATSTLINDLDMRIAQFNEFARVIKPDGHILLVTGRLAHRIGQHCLNQSDIEILQARGFKLVGKRFWGIFPRSLWNIIPPSILSVLERLVSPLGLGARQILVFQKQG